MNDYFVNIHLTLIWIVTRIKFHDMITDLHLALQSLVVFGITQIA